MTGQTKKKNSQKGRNGSASTARRPNSPLEQVLGQRVQRPHRPREARDVAGKNIASHPSAEPERPTDYSNAERLVKLHGADLRYCGSRKGWLVWDETRWLWDETSEVERRAKRAVRALYSEAEHIDDSEKRVAFAKRAVYSESHGRIAGMIALAKSEAGIPVTLDQLDRDPWLLNVANGTLNLHTGKLREHQRSDLITKLVPVAYHRNTGCPEWLKFLKTIMKGDVQLIAFLKRAVGYCLTGETNEQCLFILHGTGANGKSTFLRTISASLGDYAATASTDTFMVKDGDGPRNDVARLKGSRFVSAAEAEDGRQLAEALIKQMTGGDRLTARFLYNEAFEFQPAFKLWLAVNHKPVIKGTDNAIWRRIRLVPFEITIPEEKQDKTLPAKLQAELPGILRWAVEGCLAWQREGLKPPEAVVSATNEYRSEMDVLDQFLAERCVTAKGAEALRHHVTVAGLYGAYEQWCGENGIHYPLTKPKLGSRLRERGLKNEKRNGEHVWLGIALREGDTSQNRGGQR